MATKHKDNSIKICLLGPSFDTGNLGVSALTESSIKAILNRWPDAQVTLLGSGRVDCEYQLTLFGRQVKVKSLPIRFCRNVFLPNHFAVLFFYALFLKLFRWQRLRRVFAGRNRYVKAIVEADMIADITGGDSFSDVYGARRFVVGFLRKWLIKVFRKKLILLPQTYGPFNKRVTKALARHILNYATVVYSRDRNGVNYVKKFLNTENTDEKIRFVPDVGFILDPRRPEDTNIDSLEKIKATNRILVGLNISGLLSRSGDTRDNMFNLKVDYPALINSVVELLMNYNGTAILLVPHLVGSPKFEDSRDEAAYRKGYEESDATVCRKVYEQNIGKYNNRLYLVRGHYNHNETKYIIGLCDFFIGSRMHACIAALSQYVPAVGIAYSKKFYGVFESIGLADCVVDARGSDEKKLLEKVETVFNRKEQIRKRLQNIIPAVQREVLDIFNDLEV